MTKTIGQQWSGVVQPSHKQHPLPSRVQRNALNSIGAGWLFMIYSSAGENYHQRNVQLRSVI